MKGINIYEIYYNEKVMINKFELVSLHKVKYR